MILQTPVQVTAVLTMSRRFQMTQLELCCDRGIVHRALSRSAEIQLRQLRSRHTQFWRKYVPQILALDTGRMSWAWLNRQRSGSASNANTDHGH